MKLFCPSSFIQGRYRFGFFGGVSRGEMPHPVSHVVWRGQGCPCFLGPRVAHGEAGLACDDSRALAVACLCDGPCGCQCPHPALVVTVHHHGSTQEMALKVLVMEKSRHPLQRQKSSYMAGGWRKSCVEEPIGVGLGQSLSCGASNFWRDSTLGTSRSGHRWITLPSWQ